MKHYGGASPFGRARRKKALIGIGVVATVVFIMFATVALRRTSGGASKTSPSLNTIVRAANADNSVSGVAANSSTVADTERVNEVLAATPSPPTTRPPQAGGDASTKPLAIIHTDHGDIMWELLPDDAPKTVANIVRMAREGVFNRSCFYRYEQGFVLQGGLHCNKPPPHHGKAKNVPLEYRRRNEKYTVALARAGGDLNSGGTEFFINLRDNSGTLGPGKKGGYAVFAVVVDGLDTIAALKKLPTKTGGLTRFVSPQPVIEYIEIRNYHPIGGDDIVAESRAPKKRLAADAGGTSKKKASHHKEDSLPVK